MGEATALLRTSMAPANAPGGGGPCGASRGGVGLFHLGPMSLPVLIPTPIKIMVIVLQGVLLVLSVLSAFAWAIVVLFRSSLASRFWLKLWARAQAYASNLEPGGLIGLKNLLIVRPVADEASAALTVGQFLAWLVGYIDAASVRLLAPGFVIAVAVGMIEFILTNKEPQVASNLLLGGAALILGASLASLGIRVVMALPFGLPISRVTALLDISAEASPVGTWTILQLSPLETRGLHHSSTHEDPDVAAAVADWLLNPV